ncbi:hypothetical protein [Echinicola vietnamensis]|uniref:Lipocalin-like domain-containing protein n=1 Tax=Echinicola vietnamensis (strain DSM 17526 / LMG 23754 / KMM 6221) TaxID=926556 RepID=L0G350_ECHVK|nr:hypothetical protein [Echinicola vietnamensis]AGA79733.1 hypothetical protein Echvi_3517 [Echinicola vietnamensis DSM 17526]
MNKFSFILLLFLLAECNAEAPEPVQTLDGIKKAIIGEWNWEETIVHYRGQEPVVKTPESEGKTKTYIFSKDGKLKILEDETTIQETDYEIVLTETSGIKSITLFRLNFSDNGGSMFLTFTKHKLNLSNGLGLESSFTRK